ncbi:unnamed protein product [Prorocentrum cordatum]|uniref:Tc1-like transposase DDE domain-containing protein n=1 Tax=Prorocentrum cordatum TaxID=2364126 RepID=A0ABN9QM44_9DINO|nr:unnamed protein product [Polarella glacialis]
MGLTGAVQARRALVKLLLTVAAAYSVVVRLHRGSQDSEVIAASRKVLRKARPDKGGADEHAKQLNAAKERWDQAKKPRGRPKRAEQPEAPAGAAAADGAPGETFQDLIAREVSKKAYRVQSAGVLLTHFGVQGLPQWRQFLAHMPVVSEMRHPKGFSFQQERRIVLLREATQSDGSHVEWSEIAKKVNNLLGKRPRPRHVANTCRRATARRGPLKYDYKKCGKKPDKVTKEVERFLVKKLKEVRCRTACTSTTLQLLLASEMKVKVTVRYVRKVLSKKGFRWLPKRQKRLYSKDQRKARLTFAKKVLRMTSAELNTAFTPKLSGDDEYGGQVPLARAVPMWAGCAAGGLSIVAFHPTKKLCGEDWAKIVNRGDLVKAVKSVNPKRKKGPWSVLCDNESFLRAKVSNAAVKAAGVKLWKMPAKSPDLNPAERCWSWLRRKLRLMDLDDAVKKRPVLGKTAYRARVRSVVKSKKAQSVGAAQAKLMKRVCREVVRKMGAATGF